MQHEKALAEDPTTFSYDDVHDEIVAKRNEKMESQKKADKDKKVSADCFNTGTYRVCN